MLLAHKARYPRAHGPQALPIANSRAFDINWRHPLAPGLCVAVLCREPGTFSQNIVRTRGLANGSGNSTQDVAGGIGAMRGIGAASTVTDDLVEDQAAFTVALGMVHRTVSASVSTVGAYDGGTARNQIQVTTTDIRYSNNYGSSNSFNTAFNPTVGERYTVVASTAASNNATLYVNGLFIGTSTSDAGATSTRTGFRIMISSQTEQPLYDWCFFWNRGISQIEQRFLHMDPYSLLLPRG